MPIITSSKSILLLISICLLFSFLQAISARRFSPKNLSSPTTGKQYTFAQQFIDHFNPLDGRTFSQRYWVADEFYSPGPNSPIFFYICGEGTCTGTPSNKSFPYQMAQKMGALLVALEHRYYGYSQPFGPESMKTANLRYLTVEQALNDIAYFMSWFKENYAFKIHDSQPWITIGGSYPGCLSAWLRNKYPHLTVGAWASSSGIKSILDFSDLDYQVYLGASRSGPECPQAIEKLNQYFEYQLYETSPDVQQALKARFGEDALKLSNEELLYFIADTFAGQIQFSHRVELCNFLTNFTDFDQLVNASIPYLLANNAIRAYGAYFVRNDTFDPAMDDMLLRQWNYQVCSQLGWFQTYSNKTKYAMRSSRINLDFFKQFCKNVFDVALWPDTDRFNNDFGGVDLRTTNLILTTGAEDPWKTAAKNTTTGSMTAIFIDCPDCGHCIDLYQDNSTVPDGLKQAHAQIHDLLLNYLGQSSKSESIIY